MAAPGVNKLLDRFVAGYEGSGITINSLGVETLSSAKQIPSTGWIAQIVLPSEEAFAPVRAMRPQTPLEWALINLTSVSLFIPSYPSHRFIITRK